MQLFLLHLGNYFIRNLKALSWWFKKKGNLGGFEITNTVQYSAFFLLFWASNKLVPTFLIGLDTQTHRLWPHSVISSTVRVFLVTTISTFFLFVKNGSSFFFFPSTAFYWGGWGDKMISFKASQFLYCKSFWSKEVLKTQSFIQMDSPIIDLPTNLNVAHQAKAFTIQQQWSNVL